MPQECEVEPKKFQGYLQLWPGIFDAKTKNLKCRSDPIWTKIKNFHNLKMNPDSIYYYVYKNMHESLRNLTTYFKLPMPPRKKRKRDDDSPYDPLLGDFSAPKGCPRFEIDIVCPKDEILVVDKNKIITTTEYWGDFIAEKIIEKKNLPCKYNLKTKWFAENSLKFKGGCSLDECKCPIEGVCDHLEGNTLTISIKTFDCSSVEHDDCKRHLRGKRRVDAGNQLLYQSAAEYREEKIANLKEVEDKEPVTLSSEAVLRKVRQEKRDKLINFQEFKGQSLMNDKFIKQCNIRLLSLNPFYVFYCSDEQIDLWNKLSSKKLPLSFDATGSLVKRYRAHDIRSKHIFYYALVLGLEGKIIKVMQALLSIHHVLIILQVLKKWLECGANIPGEISTDGSPTLQHSVNLAFNGETYQEYNLHCYQVLKDSSVPLPPCFYRQDVAHEIKSFIKWSVFKNYKSEHVTFYTRCFGYVIQIDSLEEFEATVKAIVIVANSTVSYKDSICTKKKEQLLEVIQTYQKKMCDFESSVDVSKETQNNEDVKNNGDEKNIEDAKNKEDPKSKAQKANSNELINFIDKLFKDAYDSRTVDDTFSKKANFLFNEEFSKRFQKLCYSFPAWTNVMANSFNSPNETGNSARSETQFGIQKRRNSTPTAIAKFLLKDKKSIDAHVKIGSMKVAKGNNNVTSHEKEALNVMKLDLLKVTVPPDTHVLLSQLIETSKKSPANLIQKLQNEKAISHSGPLRLHSSSCSRSSIISKSESIAKDLDAISLEDVSLITTINDASIRRSDISNGDTTDIKLMQYNGLLIIEEPLTHDDYTLKEDMYDKDQIITVSVDDLNPHRYFGNANLRHLKCVRYNGVIIEVSNTCPIDSLGELVIHSMKKEKIFEYLYYTSIQSKDAKNIFTMLSKYSNITGRYDCNGELISAQRCDTKIFYDERIYLMVLLKKNKKDVLEKRKLDCRYSITRLCGETMFEVTNSFEQRQCSNCTHNEKIRLTIVTPNSNYIIDNGIGFLNDAVAIALQTKDKYHCKNCKQPTITKSFTVDSFIFIDCEDCYRSHLNRFLQRTNAAPSMLSEIPKTIFIENSVYNLSGFIAFSGELGLPHYFCLSYIEQKKWLKVDDFFPPHITDIFEDTHNEAYAIATLLYIKPS